MNREIVICARCNGDGRIQTNPYDNRRGYSICTKCRGSGRLEKITTIKYKPYRGIDKSGNVIK